jgi:Domain of unknown function (DUF4386)
MTAEITDDSQKTYARLAGVMYFFTVFDITGVIIVSHISGKGSFLNTAHSIAAWETLYRIGLILGLIGTMSTILLAIGLYVTLKPVSLGLAMTALLFRLAESTIGGVVVALSFVVLCGARAAYARGRSDRPGPLDERDGPGPRVGKRGDRAHRPDRWHRLGILVVRNRHVFVLRRDVLNANNTDLNSCPAWPRGRGQATGVIRSMPPPQPTMPNPCASV